MTRDAPLLAVRRVARGAPRAEVVLAAAAVERVAVAAEKAAARALVPALVRLVLAHALGVGHEPHRLVARAARADGPREPLVPLRGGAVGRRRRRGAAATSAYGISVIAR